MKILGIESSCDETAAAVIEGSGQNSLRVLSSVISSQIDIHKQYGGIVPEVAAREHVLNILPVINQALSQAKIHHCFSPLTKGRCPEGRGVLDAIAVTVGPGLITSLQVGVETAKTFGFAWKVPIVAINHIEGHIYAGLADKFPVSDIQFPIIILTVSGGHTLLVLMRGWGKYETIGGTRDDAAGEAFDKAAQALGLGFPGGPAIAQTAKEFEPRTSNFELSLPRPMIDSKDYDFSFSGLKTALIYAIKDDPNYKLRITNYSHEFQEAVVDVLVTKLVKAAKAYHAKTVMLTGGVSANARLRQVLDEAVNKDLPGAELLIPDLKYTTDNAAMIATAGYFHALKKDFTPWQDLRAQPNLELI